MSVYVDTSALYAILDAADGHHLAADAVWRNLLEKPPGLVTSNYILVESSALVQNRLGLAAVRTLLDDVVPLLSVEWVTPGDHEAAVSALRVANRRNLSLVDCSSFQVMRRLSIRDAFAYDQHFAEQGFRLL